MEITALAPWFGSKRTLAPRIVEQLGPHRCYWEPFCGSMAVLLAKPEVSQETVSDLHGDLVNLARVIADPAEGPRLYRRLRRTLVCEDLHRDAAARLRERALDRQPGAIPNPDAAYDFFLGSWLGRNGVIGTESYNQGFCVRYTTNGGIQGTRFAAAVRSIPAWRRRLREVTILRRDGLALLERIEDQAGVSIYCDPPYLQKGATYVHDFAAADHGRLAELAGRFRRARVVVSYYDDPRLEPLYPPDRWTKIPVPVAKSMAVQGRRGSTGATAPEALLVNGPAYGQAGGDLFGGQS